MLFLFEAALFNTPITMVSTTITEIAFVANVIIQEYNSHCRVENVACIYAFDHVSYLYKYYMIKLWGRQLSIRIWIGTYEYTVYWQVCR